MVRKTLLDSDFSWPLKDECKINKRREKKSRLEDGKQMAVRMGPRPHEHKELPVRNTTGREHTGNNFDPGNKIFFYRYQ